MTEPLPAPLRSRFQPGGTLGADGLYVERAADRQLVEALDAGELCYVLAPRQIGKSSLRVRAARRLRERGARVVTVDLTRIGGADTSAEGWYFGVVQELATRLYLDGDPADFWRRHAQAAPVRRLVLFLRDQVLAVVRERVVVFFDEIDAVLALPFSTDDFFATLRDAYNVRAEEPDYRRLTFCLLGVAAPGDLMRDAARTPFNVGRAIRLEDFTPGEAEALLPGLRHLGAADAIFASVLGWTSGHPYMTQKLCAAIAEVGADRPVSVADVDALVGELFLNSGRTDDPNLEYAERRLHASPQAAALVQLYGRLLSSEAVPADRDDPIQQALRLTGMAAERAEGGRHLAVRNRIFATVFNEKWVREEEALRLLAGPLERWLHAGRRDDFVLRGSALDEAQEWARGRRDLAPDESEFLRAGLEVARREEAAEAARKQALVEARSLRRTLTLVIALGVLLMTALVIAVAQSRAATRAAAAEHVAREAADAATLREKGALAAALSTQAGREPEAVRSALEAIGLSRAAGRRFPAAATSALASSLGRVAGWPLVRRPPGVAITRVAWSDDLGTLAASTDAGRALVWDVPEVAPVKSYVGEGPPHETRFVDGGRAILYDGEVEQRLVDPATGRVRLRAAAKAAALSLDGAVLFTADATGLARLDVASGRELLRVPLKAIQYPWLALSPDGRHLVSSGEDEQEQRLWDAATLAPLGRLRYPSRAAYPAYFTPGGKELVHASEDGRLRIWDVATARLRLEVAASPLAVQTQLAVSPDGERIAVPGAAQLRIYHRASGAAVATWPLSGRPTCVAWSPDGQTVAVGRRDGRVSLLDGATGGEMSEVFAHAGYVMRLDFLGRGLLATSGRDGNAHLYALGLPMPRLTIPTGSARNISLDAHGRRIASVDRGPSRVWDGKDGHLVAVLDDKATGSAIVLPFSPDGARLVSGSGSVWDIDRRALEARLPIGAGIAWAAFSADGSELFTAIDNNLSLTDSRTGTERLRVPLSGQQSRVAFSADGARLVAGSLEGAVRVFDRAGRLLLERHTPQAAIIALRLAGGRLAAGSEDGLRVWDAATGEELLALSASAVAISPDASEAIVVAGGGYQRMPLGERELVAAGCRFLEGRGELEPVRAFCK